MTGVGAVRLHVAGASIGYAQGAPVVADVELTLRAGEVLTLIGPNGSGKSTILKSAARQLDLLGGCVYLDGDPLRDMPAAEVARRMSILMTQRVNPELMTCEDVVATGRHPYTGRLGLLDAEDRARVAQCLALVHAEELAGRDFCEVSDGQRQRVLLARSLCQDPEVMVLDEPTSFLDIRHKLELLSILRDAVRERGLAVLMSLHELDLAQRVSDTVACVHGGRVERVGTPDEVFCGDYIRKLYGLETGSYDAAYGSLEMPPVPGVPRVFVVGGAGRGVVTYRRLQRAGVPFAAGVLHEGDLDLPAARALAAEVVCERAFCPVGAEAFARAAGLVRSCERLVCCLGADDFGPGNARNRELVALAQGLGKAVEHVG